MTIQPYISVGHLTFGVSTNSDSMVFYGNPKRIRRTRKNVEEHHYDGFIVRFNPSNDTFKECTLLPQTPAFVAEIPITWDRGFLLAACEADGNPLHMQGFIILRRLGIAVTGIHDEDQSQMAVTAFSKGMFESHSESAMPFDVSSLREE